MLAAAALSLPLAASVRAQVPGTLDNAPVTGFTPTTVAATIYALLFETDGFTSAILAGGDTDFLETDLQPSGVEKGTFVESTYGGLGRIVFTAVPERVVSAGSAFPKVLLGGLFGQSGTQILNQTPAQNIVRISEDGTLDTAFVAGVNGGANGYVTSILPLANGQIVVGGLFTTFNVQPRLRIVRLNNNGTIDGTFNNSSAIDYDVLALAEGISPTTGLVDGTTLVAGDFNHVGGQSVSKLARLDASGNLDPTFKPVINTRVIALVVQPNGKIIIGGEFTSVNGTAVSHIARLNYDGSLDTTFSAAVTGEPTGESAPVAVYVLKQTQGFTYQLNSMGVSVPVANPTIPGKIYVGGNFTQIDGATRRYLGLINPNGTVTAFDPGTAIYDKVQSIFVQPNGRVLVGETLGPKIGKTYQPSYVRLFGATPFQ